jgi:hypothetical protein
MTEGGYMPTMFVSLIIIEIVYFFRHTLDPEET